MLFFNHWYIWFINYNYLSLINVYYLLIIYIYHSLILCLKIKFSFLFPVLHLSDFTIIINYDQNYHYLREQVGVNCIIIYKHCINVPGKILQIFPCITSSFSGKKKKKWTQFSAKLFRKHLIMRSQFTKLYFFPPSENFSLSLFFLSRRAHEYTQTTSQIWVLWSCFRLFSDSWAFAISACVPLPLLLFQLSPLLPPPAFSSSFPTHKTASKSFTSSSSDKTTPSTYSSTS